ncbi:hypothetical protein ACODM8_04740 [Vibrio ostreicida]|uniref:hypothetical protein n=1 Tax=Vibrio ostreicida TaxID=526588 RepID=UPI0009708110|nr:hypothetical protein [Vibrio ostreicida]
MAIQIEDTLMQSTTQLTTKNQLLLNLIPNASPWINWNITNQSSIVSFNSEDELIEQLGVGLAGTSVIDLPHANLTVDIRKLIELSSEDTLSLISNIDTHNAVGRSISNIIKQYHLLTNDELNMVNQFFNQNHLTIPLGWGTGLGETIQCYQSLDYSELALKNKSSLKTDATQWALLRAQTLAEFGCYYCLYLHIRKHLNGKPTDVDGYVNQLVDVVLENLDCPLVSNELDPSGLKNTIIAWNKSGNNLGFSSLASGLLCIGMNIDFKHVNQLKEQAKGYLQQLQNQLCEHLPSESYINQAGQCRHYFYTLPDREIVVNVNEIGCVSLYSDLPIGNLTAAQELSTLRGC